MQLTILIAQEYDAPAPALNLVPATSLRYCSFLPKHIRVDFVAGPVPAYVVFGDTWATH